MIYNTHADLSSEEASISIYNVDDQVLSDSLHRHERNEIILITKGSGEWQIGEKEGRFGPGTLGYAKSGTLHSWNANDAGASGSKTSAIVLHFPREALPQAFLELKEVTVVKQFFEKVNNGAVVQIREFDRIHSRLRTILGSRGMLRIARTHALFDLIAHVNGWQVVGYQDLENRKRLDRARLKTVYKYLDSHFRQPVSRDAVARLVEMEPNSFSRFFHRASGQKFSDYLAVIRVRHAATLLGSRRSLPVSQIASESGFRNLSVFNQQFRKRLGVTPAAYRKQLDSELIQP